MELSRDALGVRREHRAGEGGRFLGDLDSLGDEHLVENLVLRELADRGGVSSDERERCLHVRRGARSRRRSGRAMRRRRRRRRRVDEAGERERLGGPAVQQRRVECEREAHFAQARHERHDELESLGVAQQRGASVVVPATRRDEQIEACEPNECRW